MRCTSFGGAHRAEVGAKTKHKAPRPTLVGAGKMAAPAAAPPQRVLRLTSGISFSGDAEDEPEVIIGLPAEYPPLKFHLDKVLVMRHLVQDGEPGEVIKDPVPIVLFGRLDASSKRLDEEEGDIFVVLGTVQQLALANELLQGALPFGVGALEYRMRVSFQDILRFDEHLNREERAFLAEHGCEAALQTPAVFVDGDVFSSEYHGHLVVHRLAC